MKKFLLFFILGVRICIAQENVFTISENGIQNHIQPPQIDGYYWDTLVGNWDYDKTVYMYYTGNKMTSSLSYDTINAVPLQRDTTGYDSLGRMTLLQTSFYDNGSWLNSQKFEYIYTDTTFENVKGFYY